MKTLRIITLLLVALVSMAANARRTPGDKVGVAIDTLSYDFGTVAENSAPVVREFTLTNVGSEPVAILSAKASCGCTAPDYSRRPVKPGESTVIKVTFNPYGQIGEADKSVRVKLRSADNKKEEITLRLRGMVLPKNH